MRKLFAVVPIVALAVTGSALVASAGIEETAPAERGYTVLLEVTENDEATPAAEATPSEGDEGAASTAEDDVDAQQGGCVGRLAAVEFATGVVTPLPAGFSELACAGDLAFGPDGTLYGLVRGVDGQAVSELVTFDLASGAATLRGVIGSFNSTGGFGEGPIGGITFDAAGTLYALLQSRGADGDDPSCPAEAGNFSYCLYRVDPANPADATFVGVSIPSQQAVGGPLASSCSTVYAMRYDGENPTDVATVDTATGALTPIGQVTPSNLFVFGADFDHADTFWSLIYTNSVDVSDSMNVATLDPQGGTPIQTLGAPLVAAGGAPVIAVSLAVEPLDCAQPEPAPIVLEPTFTG